MNQTQKEYAKCKAQVDQLMSEYTQHMMQYANLLDTDAGIDQYVEIEMAWEAAHGYQEANNELKKAEEAMVDWAIETIKKCPGIGGFAYEIEMLRHKAKRYISIWYKLVDLAYRYDGNIVPVQAVVISERVLSE